MVTHAAARVLTLINVCMYVCVKGETERRQKDKIVKKYVELLYGKEGNCFAFTKEEEGAVFPVRNSPEKCLPMCECCLKKPKAPV